jgi:hypothetical protein
MFMRGLYRSPDGVPSGSPDGATTTTTPVSTAATTTPEPQAFDWSKAGLDADSLSLVTERQFKAPGDVVQSYRNLEKLIGLPPERIVKLPGEKDAPEAWNQVYDRLGRPKAATDYKIPLPAGDTGEFAKALAPIFHEAGLSQGQVQKIAEKHNALVAQQSEAATKAATEKQTAEITSLKNEWGADWQKNNDIVDKAAEQFGMTPDHILALKQAMGPAAAMKFLHTIGSKIAVESAFIAGDTAAGFKAMTPDMAEAAIMRNNQDPTFVQRFNSPDPVVRGQARAESERLHQIAYPGEVSIGSSKS